MRGFFVVALVIAALLPCAACAEPTRIALVIGNGAYVGEGWPPLANPRVDAGNVSRAFQTRGYRVTTLTDLGRDAMRDALDRFALQIRAVEPGSVAVVYYAGHGYAVAGANYLVPVDARGVRDSTVMVAMDSFLSEFGERDGVTTIAIFDACRDTPAGARGEPAGFARVERPNSFIAFSAGVGNTAAEGGQGLGSPFANALVQTFEGVPHLTPAQLFEIVRPIVHGATQGQTPVEFNTLASRVRINGNAANGDERRVALAFHAAFDDLSAESVELARGAAERGSVRAMELIGALYFRGSPDLPLNERTALGWFARAMAAGGRRERLNWAVLAAFSQVVDQQERDHAIAIIQEEAARNDPQALDALGYAHAGAHNFRFTAFRRDLGQGLNAYRRGYEAGHIGAATGYAEMLVRGQGLAGPDWDGAGAAYLRAAESGSPGAMSTYARYLSTFCLRRRHSERDEDALYWYGRAARMDNANGWLGLAVLHAYGIGVPVDRAAALRHLQNAERVASHYVRTMNPTLDQWLNSFARDFRSGAPLVEPLCNAPWLVRPVD
jgi:TPR repeat protein